MDGWLAERESSVRDRGYDDGRHLCSALLCGRELVQKGPKTCSERALNDVRARFRCTRVVSGVFLFRRYCTVQATEFDAKRSRRSSEE